MEIKWVKLNFHHSYDHETLTLTRGPFLENFSLVYIKIKENIKLESFIENQAMATRFEADHNLILTKLTTYIRLNPPL